MQCKNLMETPHIGHDVSHYMDPKGCVLGDLGSTVSTYARSAVIMKNLVTALAREHHFTQWCSAVIALARFFIITAELARGRPW